MQQISGLSGAAHHSIRKLRILVDTGLGNLDGLLAEHYAQGGRPSIPPERIPRASLPRVVYGVRSERLLIEQMTYNLLFHWFVGALKRRGIKSPIARNTRGRRSAIDVRAARAPARPGG